MEKCSGSTPPPPKGEAEVANSTATSKVVPPQVITVDTSGNVKDEDKSSTGVEGAASTARTPKHANKTTSGPAARRAPHPSHGGAPGFYPYEGRPVGGNGAFQPHDSRRQPPPHSHASDHQYYNQPPPIHVSPGGAGGSAAAYDHRGPGGGGPYYNRQGPGGYPPHGPPPGYYDHRGGYNDYGHHPQMSRPPPHSSGQRYDIPHSQHMRGQHQYPPQHYPQQSYNGYQSDPRNNPNYGSGPQPNYPPAVGQYPPNRSSDQHYPRENHGYPPPDPQAGPNNSAFSRSVSASFDRSIKQDKPVISSKTSGDNQISHLKNTNASQDAEQQGDSPMASDDISWKQLNQVHSIDDAAIQEHLRGKKSENVKKEDKDEESPSNSSSLTNSPTEGASHQRALAETIAAVPTKTEEIQKTSSLDELCSVASAQAPMDTEGSNKKKNSSVANAPSSPGTVDSASLDLMKCSSDGSGLLNLVPPKGEGLLYDNKDEQVEERGDKGESAKGGEELRRAPSDLDEKPPKKKARVDSKEALKVEKSPLSITCSPSAAATKKGFDNRKAPSSQSSTINKTDFHASPNLGGNSLYDKPPTYSYSMDSAPSLPRGSKNKHSTSSNPALPPRPTSSSSSTLTPGNIPMENQDPTNGVVSSIPSWEINAVDSFGGGSVGGQGLSNNFSFQDYPMLSATESNLGNSDNRSMPPQSSALPPHTLSPGQHYGGMNHPRMHPHQQNHPVLESRNQSFEGGHYHGGGSFHRTDSMDYGRGPGPAYHDGGYKHGYQGPFPPHAPSWGTAASAQSHPSYQQGHPGGHHSYMGGRMGDYPPVMRNYSHDSGHRASPPPGPIGPHGRHYMHRPPPNFQPPPEFVAPHNPQLTRRPPPAVYIMSSQGANHPNSKRGTGVFSWSKDDDRRLTEIMKKYKNPRDWEPIAKEHGMGKSAKDCHERWIRYLKPGVRKGQWTDQEDSIVIDAVQNSSEQPFTRWSDLAQRLPGRVGKQIRDRWVNHLNPNINHLPFSREDDLLLWEGHKKLGKRWVEISSKSFNSTRSENHIKNRWYSASFKKFISNEFGPDAYSGGKSKGKDDKGKSKTKNIKEDPATKAVGT
eukprot:CAMPEP_0197197888 /NCGR_PEP_ID=MMETSP1423-20130617/33089_1 /TAXON_ID=476441 /ORGANISM="Pseudo-nitzschia heimii, Strain UNC1101" /LENGTH=1090 /DNA_ID=CAMNT_0042651715 /DNA_START=72 /DNA_END=3344 /DNA_ORIENTATION=-